MKTPIVTKNSIRAGLYLLPTPIGNLGDITLRTIELLEMADEIWAEDTRNIRKLLSHFNIRKEASQLRACHEHNEDVMSEKLSGLIGAGKVIAFASDAGMPLVSDPGYRLIQKAREQGLYYTVLPGASAVPTALALSGLPTHRFAFFGFAPNKPSARRKFFESMQSSELVAIYFESPRRLGESLSDAASVFGQNCEGAVVREISKTFEEVVRGPVSTLAEKYQQDGAKGEIVVLFDLTKETQESDDDIEAQLRQALQEMKLNDAVKFVAQNTNRARNEVYKLALALKS